MATSSKKPFEVSDFSLGLTDDPFEKDPRYSVELDNINIEPDGSIKSRDGSVIEDTTNPQITSGEKRIGQLIDYDKGTNLLVISEDSLYYRNPSAYAELTGPSSNPLFTTGVEASNVSRADWNKQVYLTNDDFPNPMKVYKDSAGDFQLRNSGLPALASTPTGTPTAGANTYLYAFHYEYEYTVGSQTFQDVGPVTQLTVGSADAPDSNQIALASIPAISNGSDDNYDTANIKVQIFRTIAGGSTFYYVGEVTNGTTTYNDTTSDATLQDNVLMYTEDGTREYDPVPLHKYNHVVNGIGFYGFIKDGSVEYPFRIRQSIPFNPSGCPASFFYDLEDEVKGIGSTISLPIVFCANNVYRIDSTFDQFGRGGIVPTRISDTAGCVSHLSIVSAEGKIFWAGNDGFYFSDGYKVQKISDKINARYANWLAQIVDPMRIQGKFDTKTRKIYWTTQKDSASLENDQIVTLDLRWGLRDNSTFTTWSGTSFKPACIEFFNGKLYRGDDNGYVYYHDSDELTDPKVDVNVAAANWEEETIIWNYKSLNFDFGSNFFRKKPTRILLMARSIANTSIQINSIDDDGKRTRVMTPIRWRKNFTWGDETFTWGDPTFTWRGVGIIEEWRRFPSGGLRVSYCQIQITNAYAVIVNSDIYEEATFDGLTNSATLPTLDWPTSSVDYFISTSDDSYDTQFKIDTVSTDTITVIDSEGSFPTGSLPWLIKGYRKGEPINLLGFIIHVDNNDQMHETFETGDAGGNA